jgi:alkylation response protein AidB-like acyl-CoA dehydrogenase
MDLTFNARESAFREELCGWLAQNPPDPEPAGAGEAARFAWRRDWQRRLYDGGWAAPHWPAEYGGRGATLTESAIYFEELGRARVPLPVNILGLLLGGPTLMVWGTPEQKERWLAPILSAREIWCQGFSEPDAGSDLASLKTRAVRDPAHPGEWVVSGQKVWTSAAQFSKWCMLVARTDTQAPKHKGLTYFVMDMEQEAVQVRPLRQITGEAEFNELFIEEARIPEENVVGGVGNGWKVALTTLMNERAGLGFTLQIRLRQLLDDTIARAAANGLLEDPLYADALAELHMRCESIRLLAWRGLTATERYGQPGPEGSLVKWLWSETNQRLTQLAADIVGPRALMWDTDGEVEDPGGTVEDSAGVVENPDGPAGTDWSYELLRARGNSIEGGTTEVLKNIVAERVLGLPRLQPAAAS